MLSDWGELQKPTVFTWKNVGWAIVVHIAFFVLCWILSIPLPNKEIAIPIDLTVVINENLDGNPDEPPPETPPVPQPKPTPPPPPAPAPQPAPTPAPIIQQDAVIQKKKQEKPPKKKIEKPKETKEERLKRMRESAKQVKTSTPQPKPPTREERIRQMQKALAAASTPPQYNGRTEKRPDNWQQLLNQGYKAGAKTQIASSEEQRCISLIKAAFDRAWEQVGIPPWTDTLREMYLQLKLNSAGKIVSYRLSQSSSDARVDKTVLSAAQRMNVVYGLSAEFLESNGGNVTIKVKVRPR